LGCNAERNRPGFGPTEKAEEKGRERRRVEIGKIVESFITPFQQRKQVGQCPS